MRVISDTHLAYTTAMIGDFESFANISKNKKKGGNLIKIPIDSRGVDSCALKEKIRLSVQLKDLIIEAVKF